MNLWEGMDYNISKIADYARFNLNQLRELDISNNAIVNFSSTCIPWVDLLKGGELETAMNESFISK